jgi:hypothetical protein
MNTLETLLFAAGLLHFGVLIASTLVPQVLDWKGALAPLPALFRQIVWVHGAYVVLMIVGFGLLSVLLPHELAGDSLLARGVCGFIAVFWGARLVLQFALFRPGELLRNGLLKAGYHGLTAVFAYFVCVYAAAAVSYHAAG